LITGRSVLWLGLAQLISWGITYYRIGGFGDAMTVDLGWGRDGRRGRAPAAVPRPNLTPRGPPFTGSRSMTRHILSIRTRTPGGPRYLRAEPGQLQIVHREHVFEPPAVERAIAAWRSTVNPRYTFDTFVAGPSNQLAFAASQASASSYPPKYNPVFLCGGVGIAIAYIRHVGVRRSPDLSDVAAGIGPIGGFVNRWRARWPRERPGYAEGA
jgi:hypothetical protein